MAIQVNTQKGIRAHTAAAPYVGNKVLLEVLFTKTYGAKLV